MLILRTLLFGPAHTHQIAKQNTYSTTEGVLRVEHGSLYPALYCMERKRWIARDPFVVAHDSLSLTQRTERPWLDDGHRDAKRHQASPR
jgi:hypothetical protein